MNYYDFKVNKTCSAYRPNTYKHYLTNQIPAKNLS